MEHVRDAGPAKDGRSGLHVRADTRWILLHQCDVHRPEVGGWRSEQWRAPDLDERRWGRLRLERGHCGESTEAHRALREAVCARSRSAPLAVLLGQRVEP